MAFFTPSPHAITQGEPIGQVGFNGYGTWILILVGPLTSFFWKEASEFSLMQGVSAVLVDAWREERSAFVVVFGRQPELYELLAHSRISHCIREPDKAP